MKIFSDKNFFQRNIFLKNFFSDIFFSSNNFIPDKKILSEKNKLSKFFFCLNFVEKKFSDFVSD